MWSLNTISALQKQWNSSDWPTHVKRFEEDRNKSTHTHKHWCCPSSRRTSECMNEVEQDAPAVFNKWNKSSKNTSSGSSFLVFSGVSELIIFTENLHVQKNIKVYNICQCKSAKVLSLQPRIDWDFQNYLLAHWEKTTVFHLRLDLFSDLSVMVDFGQSRVNLVKFSTCFSA